MTTMHRALLAVLLLSGIVIAHSQIVAAQTQPTLSTRPAAKPAAKAASAPAAVPTVLPTEETVNSFLFQTFGYDPTITWMGLGVPDTSAKARVQPLWASMLDKPDCEQCMCPRASR